MIKEIDVPKSGWHVTKLGAPIIAVAKAVNALRNLKFKESHRWFFSWEEGGAVIEYIPTAGIADAIIRTPWQPFLSPTATGPTAPFTLRIVPGDVTDGEEMWMPARENIEIVVPPNTKMYVWLEAGVSATAHITSLDYNFAATLPGPVTLTGDATPPSLTRKLLFVISANATALEFPPITQVCSTSLSLYPKTTLQTAAATTVVMDWQPVSNQSLVP